jgi:hypothetical protein
MQFSIPSETREGMDVNHREERSQLDLSWSAPLDDRKGIQVKKCCSLFDDGTKRDPAVLVLDHPTANTLYSLGERALILPHHL